MQFLQTAVRTSCWLSMTICGAVSSAVAATPAEAVPDSASVVVRWKAPQTSAGKLADFVDAVQPGFGAVVRGSVSQIGPLLGVPNLDGINVDADILAIVFLEPVTEPGLVYVLTAKNAKSAAELGKQLQRDGEVHLADNLIAYSRDRESLVKVRQRLAGVGTPLWSQIDASSLALFNASDLSIVVNVKELVADFASELDEAEPKLDGLIDQIVNAMPEDQQTQMASVFDIYRDLGKSLLSGVRDSQSLIVGMTFSKAAIRIENRLQVIDGTSTAGFFAKQPSSELSLMNRLPADKLVYLGTKFDMSSMVEWSMKITKGMMKSTTEEQSAMFEDAVKEMSQLKYGEMAVFFELDDEAPAFNSGAVSEVTPTDRMREISHKLMKSMGEIQMPHFKQTATLEINAEKIGGFDVDRVTIKQEFEESADPLGMQKKMQAMLFGDAGMQQQIMYQPKRVLQTMGGSTENMKELSDALDGSTEANTAVVDARTRFSAKANVVALFDVARLAMSGLKLAGEQKLLPFDIGRLDELQFDPSFIGFTLAIEPTAVRTEFEIPVAQVQNFAKIVPLLQPGR